MQREPLTDQLQRIDQQRPDFPGEHLIVLGLGALLLWKAATGRSFLFRTVAGAAGSALVGRAASGTGGIARLAGMLGQVRRPR
ncbi:MAG: hypothetical protein EOO24_34475 [Comamonadaceae bacterium]|nr:MAG: hypothetical protein EOO24_34475 [Comamonadaceae bacterium]